MFTLDNPISENNHFLGGYPCFIDVKNIFNVFSSKYKKHVCKCFKNFLKCFLLCLFVNDFLCFLMLCFFVLVKSLK